MKRLLGGVWATALVLVRLLQTAPVAAGKPLGASDSKALGRRLRIDFRSSVDRSLADS